MDSNLQLCDTVAMMNSTDYKERFKAEYYQVAIRHKKLKEMVEKWDKGTLPFTPTCPRKIYDVQLETMADYMEILEARAAVESIVL